MVLGMRDGFEGDFSNIIHDDIYKYTVDYLNYFLLLTLNLNK